MPRTSIQLPQLQQQHMQAVYAQMRPYREGGNRLQITQYKSKYIVHNYGHGGAGVSLAPGSAMQAVKLASKYIDIGNRVAVIGSGIVGLMNAYELINKYPELRVVIYAEMIPVFGEKDNSKLITSQVAPGYWLPYAYGSNNQDLHQLLSHLSYKYYQQMSKMDIFSQFLKEVDVFDISDQKHKAELLSVLTQDLKPSVRNFKLTLNNKTVVDCLHFRTLKIDMQPFLDKLIQTIKQKGVVFIRRKLNQIQMSQLPQTIIFNCAGLGSRQLINDKYMKGIKGHLLEYKNTNTNKYDYILKANIGKQSIRYYMHASRIILGLTRQDQENCNISKQQVLKLQAAHRQLIYKLGLAEVSAKL